MRKVIERHKGGDPGNIILHVDTNDAKSVNLYYSTGKMYDLVSSVKEDLHYIKSYYQCNVNEK